MIILGKLIFCHAVFVTNSHLTWSRWPRRNVINVVSLSVLRVYPDTGPVIKVPLEVQSVFLLVRHAVNRPTSIRSVEY